MDMVFDDVENSVEWEKKKPRNSRLKNCDNWGGCIFSLVLSPVPLRALHTYARTPITTFDLNVLNGQLNCISE